MEKAPRAYVNVYLGLASFPLLTSGHVLELNCPGMCTGNDDVDPESNQHRGKGRLAYLLEIRQSPALSDSIVYKTIFLF